MNPIRTISRCPPQICYIILPYPSCLRTVVLPLFDVIYPSLPLFVVGVTITGITCSPVFGYIYQVFFRSSNILIHNFSCNLAGTCPYCQLHCRIKLHTVAGRKVNGTQATICKAMDRVIYHLLPTECSGTHLDHCLIQLSSI